jgi:geranylgeranyl reductase family protein
VENYDVIVAGAGPSGSTTAYRLAKAGVRVLLLERAVLPRDKPCGGGVTAHAYAQTPVDLTPVVEHVVNRVRFSYKLGEFFDYEYPETLVYMTQRLKMDAYLAGQAAAAGAVLRDGVQVRGIEVEADGSFTVRANGIDAKASVLVGADGSNGIVGRSLGLKPFSDPPVALEASARYRDGDGPPGGWQGLLALELGSMAGGYGWSFPKIDHFNVGCGGWRGEGGRLRDHVASLIEHYDLASLEVVNYRGHHLPTREGTSPITRGRALLVGDAAGLVDPMSGEGIHAAFVSGRLAAESIEAVLENGERDVWRYEAAVERELMPEIRAALVLRDAYHWLPRPCYEALKRNDLLRRSLCRMMTGESNYAGFLRQLGPLAGGLRLWAALGRRARQRRRAEAS